MSGGHLGRLVLRASLVSMTVAAVAGLLYSTLGATTLSAVLFAIACALLGSMAGWPWRSSS